MLWRLWRAFFQLFTRDYIPPLPRGMLAAKYDSYDLAPDERKVLARLGARDPNGIRLAMKRANVESIEELIETLEHYSPARRILNRVIAGMGKARGGLPYHPHQRAIIAGARSSKQRQEEIKERLKTAQNVYRRDLER